MENIQKVDNMKYKLLEIIKKLKMLNLMINTNFEIDKTVLNKLKVIIL